MKKKSLLISLINLSVVFVLGFVFVNQFQGQGKALQQGQEIIQSLYSNSNYDFLASDINRESLQTCITSLDKLGINNQQLKQQLKDAQNKFEVQEKLQTLFNTQDQIIVSDQINPNLTIDKPINQEQLDEIQHALANLEEDKFTQTLLDFTQELKKDSQFYSLLNQEVQALPVNNFSQNTIDSYVEINENIEDLSTKGFRGHLVENFNHKSLNFANNLIINSDNLKAQDIDMSKLLSIDIFDHRLTGSSLDHRPLIALTFDDGPSQTTLEILDVLDKYGVQATFFQLGMNVEQYPDIANEVVKRGHLVGNHSYSHVNFNLISNQAIMKETDTTQELIYHASGVRPEFFRTPYGTNRQGMINLYPDMVPVYWNVDSQDWVLRDASATYDAIVSTLQHRSIVLMHDIFPFNVEVIDQLIPTLLNQGYIFTTPDRIPEADNYNI